MSRVLSSSVTAHDLQCQSLRITEGSQAQNFLTDPRTSEMVRDSVIVITNNE